MAKKGSAVGGGGKGVDEGTGQEPEYNGQLLVGLAKHERLKSS